MSSTALIEAAQQALPVPTFNGAEMVRALAAYRELQAALDKQMPDAIQKIGDRHFRKKGYWRAIATAFALNVECVSEEPYEHDDGEWGYRVRYRARTKTGRVVDGDGACSSAEKKGSQATEHNIRSHAHTRAFNRCVSNAVGFGEVSAEEVVHEASERPRQTKASRPAPRETVDVKTGEIVEVKPLEEAQREFITNAQRSRLFKIARDAGWKEDELRRWLEARGYERGSTQQIRRADYDGLCASLRAGVGGEEERPEPDGTEGDDRDAGGIGEENEG